MSAENLLKVSDLETHFFSYRGVVKAIDGVHFSMKKGESLGLVGETGSGKSVTALSIMRLIAPPGRIVRGEVIFQGENLLEKSEEEMRKIRGKEISMIFQDPMTSLNPVFRVGEQLSEVFTQHQGLNAKEAEKKSVDMMRSVGIPDPDKRCKQFPHQLSGGMRQRVMIAMALASRPDLLIADEPTTALDVTIQAQILELIKDLRREVGTSMLLITHNLGVVAETCDKIAIMYAGSIIEIAKAVTIFKNPLHPYTFGLLACIPRIDAPKEKLAVIPGLVPDLIDPPRGCRFHPRCEHASDRCRTEKPQLVDVGEDHWVACDRNHEDTRN
jgi:oligopeptide/dipeptide ABC transporter ATP-binding protein